MAAVAAGAAVAGTAVSVYGILKGAQDEAEMLRRQQELANAQAAELDYRSQINEALRNAESFRQKLDIGAAMAGTGHEGTGIASQLELQRQNDIQNQLIRMETDYQIRAIKMGGAMKGELADITESSAKIKAFGTVLGGAGTLASNSAFQPNTGKGDSGWWGDSPGISNPNRHYSTGG